MALTVVVRSGETTTSPAISFDSPRIVIGRGEGCEVRLPDPSISHRHASIRQRGTDYIVVDEGSTNGTFVGPVRLSPHAPRVLRSGDLIRAGRVWLEVRIEQGPPTQDAQLATAEIALGLVQQALAAQGEPALIRVKVIEGPDGGRELTIGDFGRPYVVGRGTKADLKLEDADASRRHVEIRRRGQQLFVRELGSKNGSQLGDRELETDKPIVWPRTQVVSIGKNRLSYDDPVVEALAELERAADERMRDDDSVDPPRIEAEQRSELPTSSHDHRAAIQQNASPIALVPKRSKATVPRTRGWSATDWLVALLAVLVLTLSVLGMIWLFGPLSN